VEEWEEGDRTRDPRCQFRRWVVEADGQTVGYGLYTHVMNKFDPHRFMVVGGVLEANRNRGIGVALYNIIMDGLAVLAPREIRAHAREDRGEAVRFLQKRGFREYRRESDSVLEVNDFDPIPYTGLEDRLRSEGILIRTLRELEGDPRRDRKLYDLDWEVTRDEPGSQDNTRVEFEVFVEKGLNTSWRLPDGYFVAVCDGEYVGICLLNAVAANGTATHGITGVKRAFRRRGIATAMKVRAIRYARKVGIPRIYTDNEVGNQPMLGLNNRLGFKPLPAWIFLEKRVE